MANKRQALEEQLSKANLFKDQIQRQADGVSKKIIDLQLKVDTEIMDTGDSKSIQELITTREQLIHLQASLEIGDRHVKDAKFALEDYDRSVRGGQIMELDKKVQQAIVDLQARIGEQGGLQGELDQLHNLIMEVEKLGSTDVQVHDVAIHLQSARTIYIELSNFLFKTWKQIEELKWGPAHGGAPKEPGHIPGFGMMPGYTKSA